MRRLALVVLAAIASPLAAHAQSFDSQDWLVVCDNTRTCRAAGYSADGDDHAVSLLFTRAAGAGTGIAAELQLGVLEPHAAHPPSVQVSIARKAAGSVRIDANNHGELPYPLVAALLKAYAAGANVLFVAGRTSWRVSGDGAVAVLQKMDEFQGRTGTRSAIVSPGRAGEGEVVLPAAPPREQAGRLPAPQPGDDALAARMAASIASRPECPLLDDGAAQGKARAIRLDANRALVTQPCWVAADNQGDGYWIANLRPPYAPAVVTYSGTDFDAAGTITAGNGARAARDCGSVEKWTWNGYRYEQTYAATGGLCRGVKAGGAWELPTLVTEVVPAN